MSPLKSVRWLDLGVLEPRALHAAYMGLAQAQPADAPPLLVWARSDRAHVSVGASQAGSAELDLGQCARRDIPLVQRPLGGGTVIVDPEQYCLFLILPADHAPSRHPQLFDMGLAPLLRVFADHGLIARRVGLADIWVGGRKILGSGAATIGSTMVLGTSLLMRFPAELFADLVHCPSEGFRRWLGEELRRGMTDWAAQGLHPGELELQACVRRAVAAGWGCEPEQDIANAREREAMAQAREELEEPLEPGARRLVDNGIKINHATYLVEGHDQDGWLRLVVRDGVIDRIVSSDEEAGPLLEHCMGLVPEQARLIYNLQDRTDVRHARYWAQRIDRVAAGVRRVSDG